MSEPPAPDAAEAEYQLTEAEVDKHPNGPTEDDEEEVLRRLYGPPDRYGVYRAGEK